MRGGHVTRHVKDDMEWIIMVTAKWAQMTHKWALIAPSLGPQGPMGGRHESPRPSGGNDDRHNVINGRFSIFERVLCQSMLTQVDLQFGLN